MAKKIDISDLSDVIGDYLETFTNEVIEGMEEAAKKRSLEGVKKLKKISPKDTGAYMKGWKAKKVNGKWVTYNRIYQLTHLLEKGYAKVNGGRVQGQKHIAPVEKEMIKKFISDVEKVISG